MVGFGGKSPAEMESMTGKFAFPVDKDFGRISLSNIPGVANVRVRQTVYSD